MAPTTTTQRAGCSASVPPSSLAAHVVGKAFVQQYYNTLMSSPEIAYRFYHNDSCLARPYGDDDCRTNCVITLEAIQAEITATSAEMVGVEVVTVDSHHSHGGGVTVLVTGTITFADGETRAFVQSFFLAQQDAKSYYVRNDTLRFVGAGAAAAPASASSSPAVVEPSSKMVEVAEAEEEDKDDVVHGDKPAERRGGVVQDAAGLNRRFGGILGRLRGLLLSPGISVSDKQAEEPPAAAVKNDEPEENGFLVIDR